MDRIYRVVLERPFAQTKDGSLRLRFGTTPAQRMPGYSNADFGDIGRNGAAAGIRSTQIQERPGKPIWYPATGALIAGDPVLDHVDNVPEDAVKHWFGNWDWPEDNIYSDQRMTKGGEKGRVTRYWGEYKTEYRRVGKNFAEFILGPPEVPHVAVYEMDQRGQTTGFVYRPWDYFEWDKEEYAAPEFQIVAAPVTEVSASQLFELQKQIAVLQAHIEVNKPKRRRKETAPSEAPNGV